MSLRRLTLACAGAVAAGASSSSCWWPRRANAEAPAASDDDAAAAVKAAAAADVDDAEGVTFSCYDGRDGSPRTLSDIVRAALAPPPPGGTVLLIGEAHDDSVAHAVERHVLREVWAGAGGLQGQGSSPSQRRSRRPLVLCLEMFERDVQGVLDEVLGQGGGDLRAVGSGGGVGGSNVFREEDLLRDARPWPNYVQDYRQLLLDARAQRVRVAAANAPRRYVSVAGRFGTVALEQALPAGSPAREWLAPLPHAAASPAYARRIDAAMRAAAEAMRAGQEDAAAAAAVSTARKQRHKQQEPEPEPPTQASASTAVNKNQEEEGPPQKSGCPYTGFTVSSNFLDAQSLWDATMAWTVSRELLAATQAAAANGGGSGQGPPPLVALVAGRFHIEAGLGVAEHLVRYCEHPPKVVSVTVVQSANVTMTPEQLARERVLGLADFLVLSDGRVPPSFRTVHL
jgi:uncharacterized iron-regulated protein